MRKKKLTWIVSGMFLVILLLVAVNKAKPTKETESVEKVGKLVKVETVTNSKIQSLSEHSAPLEANEQTELSFEVSGRLINLQYQEGDKVSEGSVLAQVSATEYSLQVAQTEAGLNKGQVALEQARLDFERIEKLYQQGAISLADYEKARDRLQVAEEDYKLAQQSTSLIAPDKTKLMSPINGTILAKQVTQGQTVSPGTPIYIIGQLNQLKLVLPVPDSDIGTWQVGDKLTLNLYGQERLGQVIRIHPATNQSTGTVGVEISVPNPKHDWLPGQIVVANRIEQQDGVFVPVSAVINRGEKTPYLFLVTNGKAVKKSVEIGDLFGDNLEITAGLKPGDTIVVKGADQLFDGDAIEVPGGSDQ